MATETIVYSTRNTRYTIVDGVCTQVHDKNSGKEYLAHIAIGKHVAGAVRVYSHGGVIPLRDPAGVGDSIYFIYHRPDGEERQIVTSRIEAIETMQSALAQAS